MALSSISHVIYLVIEFVIPKPFLNFGHRPVSVTIADQSLVTAVGLL